MADDEGRAGRVHRVGFECRAPLHYSCSMVKPSFSRALVTLISASLLVVASCADDPLPPPRSAAAVAATPSNATAQLPELPRSSIAAVIGRRQELGLTDDQVRDLELRDLERQKEDATVRDDVAQKRKSAADARAAAQGGGGPAQGTGNSPGGMRGGGMGGGMRGGGMGGRGPRGGGGRSIAPAPEISEASIQDRLDANDTKAFLDAEGSLADGQKDRAREIASDFREKLYERRELLRTCCADQQGAK